MNYDVVYVPDERNGLISNIISDHRVRPGGVPSGWTPSTGPAGGPNSRTVIVSPTARPAVITGTATGYYQPPVAYGSPYPATGYTSAGYPVTYGSPTPAPYPTPYPAPYTTPYGAPVTPPYPWPSIADRFGMSTGDLIDAGLQLLTAILPLPAAPVGQGDVVTDVENLATYQTALWQSAKRDEQLRTLGGLLTKILR